MEPAAINRGGRPRAFDHGEAVETAIQLFRRHGYEGVSLSMLTAAIGVAPPSLYAAFGSKAGLYRAAMDRYAAATSLTLTPDGQVKDTLDKAVERMFDDAIEIVAGPSGARGCMISTALLGCHPDHHDLEKEAAARRAALQARFEQELGCWLPSDRAGEVAMFLCAVLQGMAVQARDGATAQTLHTIAVQARCCFA